MLEYNLTQREPQIVTRLLDLSRHSKDRFEARLVDPGATGPSRELARLDFGGGGGHSMELTKRDLRLLKDEGLIHFRWHLPDRGIGRLSSLAFEARRVAGRPLHLDRVARRPPPRARPLRLTAPAPLTQIS